MFRAPHRDAAQVALPAVASLAGKAACATAHPMKIRPLVFALSCLLAAPVFAADTPTPSPQKRYVISDLGAVADGTTVNTKAIQAAIDRCAAEGGGVIVVPKGTFLSGALYFKQGVNLIIEKDAVLKSTTSMADFPPIYTRWEGIERYWTSAFLNFVGMSNVEVTGEGLIDGSGLGFGGLRGGPGGRGAGRGGAGQGGPAAAAAPNGAPPATAPAAAAAAPAPVASAPAAPFVYSTPAPTTAILNVVPAGTRLPVVNAAGVRLPGGGQRGAPAGAAPGAPAGAAPAVAANGAGAPPPRGGGGGLAPPRTVVFQNCDHVHVAGLNILNQARWAWVFIYSTDVLAENLTARNPTHSIPSSDGMDIDSCKNVHVTGCTFEANDDCLSIKAGKDEDGRRVNRPCEDILIEKTHFAFGHGGAAMGSETSGGIRNVTVRDCVCDQGNLAPIRFKSIYTRGGVVENITYENITLTDTRQAVEFNLDWGSAGAVGPRVPPIVRNVNIINVHGTVGTVGVIHGLIDSPIQGVKFVNVNLTAQRPLTIDYVRDLDTSGLTVTGVTGPAIIQRNTAAANAAP